MKNFYSTKWWTIMKIGATQIIMATLLFGVTMAHDNYGQLLDREVSLSIANTTMDNALEQVALAAAVKFAYSRDLLKLNEKVSLIADHKQLRDVLDELFTSRGIKYLIRPDGKTILLKPLEVPEGDDEVLFLTDTPPASYRILISGIVTDLNKQALAGVNIHVKGTTSGTTTDTSGAYNISADPGDILVFSFIGFASVEIKVGDQTKMDITLIEDVKGLSEVIVNAGYWEVREKEQTGSSVRVTAAQIEKQPVSNPLQSLQGRMAGVYIQQNTGMPGGGFSIQIRGQNSLRTGASGTVNGNLPLYIVDGVPFTSTSLTSAAASTGNLGGGNPLSTINPNDIENIEVLKDADATAIYGSRGANGVVLITTKRAKSGKLKVDVDLSHGIGQVAHRMDMLKTSDYLAMRREAYKNDKVTPTLTRAPDLLRWDTTRYTDWQKELIGGTGHVTNAQLNFSGGTEKTQFLLGGAYYRETTVYPGDNSYHRASGRMTVSHGAVDDRLKVSATINYSTSVNDIPTIDFTRLSLILAPHAPKLYDDNGNLNWENNTWTNPLSSLKRKYNVTLDNLVTNASISYELLKGLKLKTSAGFTSMQVNEMGINPLSAYSPTDLAGRTATNSVGNNSIKTWIIEPQLDYTKSIGDGVLSALLGTTFQESVQQNRTLEGSGYTSDTFLNNLSAAAQVNVTSNTYSQYRYAALFGRINFNWKERYIINATARRDGSSRFGPNNRFGNFGAVGAAWLFSNEQLFTDHLPYISFGKLRASYGITGSDAIGNYQYLETYAPVSYAYAGTKGLTLTRLANSEYSWESNKKFEVALELGFIEDRLLLTNAFYLNRSSAQLVGLPLPTMTGQSSVQYNLPATVENKGWESQIRTVIVKNSDVEWSTNVNFTLPFNRLLRFPDLQQFPAYISRYDVGRSVYIYKAFESTGVDPTTGIYTFADVDGSGAVSSPGDYVGLKKVTQAYYGGWGNTLRYKSFELDFLFQFVKQTGQSYHRYFDIPGTLSNQPVQVLSRWQKPGDETDLQRYMATDPTGLVSTGFYRNLSSDNMVTDASFIRLKNVSLSWQLPSQWITKLRMQNLRLSIQGQNLLTFTNYIGMDPETQSSQALPPLRMITAGIHVSF